MTAALLALTLLQGGKLLDGTQFKTDFNADKNDVRFMVILTPTCVNCLSGAREVQERIMEKLNSLRLKVYVIWTPAYGTDNKDVVQQGVKVVKDPRVKHYWDQDRTLALGFGKHVKVPRDSPLAYDCFFLFNKGTEFKEEVPSAKEYWHQILEDERYFEADKVVKVLEKELTFLR